MFNIKRKDFVTKVIAMQNVTKYYVSISQNLIRKASIDSSRSRKHVGNRQLFKKIH